MVDFPGRDALTLRGSVRSSRRQAVQEVIQSESILLILGIVVISTRNDDKLLGPGSGVKECAPQLDRYHCVGIAVALQQWPVIVFDFLE